jgi:hypothetical protein
MVLFLEGKCPETIWHGGPVDRETIPLLADLREIVKRGFVTTNGQPGTIKEETIGIKTKFGSIGEKYIEKQRGYLTGFVLTAKAGPFLDRLKRSGKVFIYRERLDAIELFGAKPEDIVRKHGPYIILTQDVGKKKIEKRTRMPIPDDTPGMISLELPMNKNLKKFLIENCTYLTIATKEFGDTGLQKLVLRCL